MSTKYRHYLSPRGTEIAVQAIDPELHSTAAAEAVRNVLIGAYAAAVTMDRPPALDADGNRRPDHRMPWSPDDEPESIERYIQNRNGDVIRDEIAIVADAMPHDTGLSEASAALAAVDDIEAVRSVAMSAIRALRRSGRAVA